MHCTLCKDTLFSEFRSFDIVEGGRDIVEDIVEIL